jgi:hypothetical protein
MMTEFMLSDGEGSGYGLGLFIDEQRGLERVHHGGADISHRSMIVYYPEIDAGLTVQSNASTFNSAATAFDLAAAFFGEAMEPEADDASSDGEAAPFDPANWNLDEFAALEGTYTLDPAPQVQARFWRSGDSLFTQLTGQPAAEIRPTSPTTFDIVIVDARIVFELDEGAETASGFTLFQNGQEIHATRLADDEAPTEDWAPTAADLEAFVGRYYSDEIETFYTFELRRPDSGDAAAASTDDPDATEPAAAPDNADTAATSDDDAGDDDSSPRLVGHQLRLGEFALTPLERDVFATSQGITLSFERDRNGQVIGLYADFTRTRDVRFERVR